MSDTPQDKHEDDEPRARTAESEPEPPPPPPTEPGGGVIPSGKGE
jgi:hypothetical protein